MRLVGFIFLAVVCSFLGCSPHDDLSDPPKLLEFSFPDFEVVSVVIDHTEKTVSVVVPYRTTLKALRPLLKSADGAVIIPSSGVLQDFSSSVYYTLTGKDGVKAIYTVKVITEDQPSPVFTAFEKDTVEAGTSFGVSGRNFGSFQLDVQTFLTDETGKETRLETKLTDSSHIRLTVPYEVVPESYSLKIKVRNKDVVSFHKIRVSYPSPQLTVTSPLHILSGDTLWVEGKYLDTKLYKFQLQLQSGESKSFTDHGIVKQGGNGFLIPAGLPAGVYEVTLFNKTENKFSKTSSSVSVYDGLKPFVTGIINAKEKYGADETVLFKTVNFNNYPVRFYQVEFFEGGKSFVQNGLYDELAKTLQITIPQGIPSGKYAIRFLLSDPAHAYTYSFMIDDQVRTQ